MCNLDFIPNDKFCFRGCLNTLNHNYSHVVSDKVFNYELKCENCGSSKMYMKMGNYSGHIKPLIDTGNGYGEQVININHTISNGKTYTFHIWVCDNKTYLTNPANDTIKLDNMVSESSTSQELDTIIKLLNF